MTDTAENLDERDATTKARILMIDDSKVMRKSVVKMLGADFDVIVAEDGAQGWEILQNDSGIQVVFTDLNMPRISGYELLKLIRTSPEEGLRNLPVIVVTGAENDDEAKELALQQGATDFITKPFNTTDLKARALSHANYHRTTKTLQQVSNVDGLTGLQNKRAFLEQIGKDISFIVRHHEDITVMVVELDGFNELFLKIGRQGADSVLKQVAKVLEKSVRQEDTVARIGLARFAVCLPTSKPDGALKLAERVVKTVESFKARLRGELIVITVSIGVYSAVKGGRVAPGTLFGQAENALVAAQRRGRSEIEVIPGKAVDLLVDQLNDERLVSIDWMLSQLGEGRVDAARHLVAGALERLKPLWVLLTAEERARLLESINGER